MTFCFSNTRSLKQTFPNLIVLEAALCRKNTLGCNVTLISVFLNYRLLQRRIQSEGGPELLARDPP